MIIFSILIVYLLVLTLYNSSLALKHADCIKIPDNLLLIYIYSLRFSETNVFIVRKKNYLSLWYKFQMRIRSATNKTNIAKSTAKGSLFWINSKTDLTDVNCKLMQNIFECYFQKSKVQPGSTEKQNFL